MPGHAYASIRLRFPGFVASKLDVFCFVVARVIVVRLLGFRFRLDRYADRRHPDDRWQSQHKALIRNSSGRQAQSFLQ